MIAPWEIDPATPANAHDVTSAETFILERVKQDSPYEGSNFVRALSMGKLNWRLRRTFCGAGQEKNPNCQLWWQRCTTCASSWFIAYWSWANTPGKVLAQAAVVDAASTVIRSSTQAVDITQYRVDILVPYGCRPEKLIDFADRISSLKATVLSKLRIVLTNFRCGKHADLYMPSSDLKSLLGEFIGFDGHSQVVIVEPPAEFKDEPFSRGKAMNMLHKACDDKAMVIAMDIDMEFTEGFLDRVRAFVIPGKSVYFPIVWSTYNPANIDKLAKFYGCERNALGRHYSGVWRSWGYGIYAMYGADAKRHMLSESFIGWGGEDNDWFKRLRDKLHIFRARERGLIHLWHTESCDEKKRSCYASKARLEGPALGFMIDKDGKPKHEEAGF